MKRIFARLDSTHRDLLDTVEALDETVLSKRPAEDEWCVAEIINHLRLVEERVLKDLNRSLEQPPAQLGLLRRFVPTSIVASRLIKVKAPRAVEPATPLDKQSNIAEFNRARGNLKALCEAHGKDKLSKAVFRHPFLGTISGVAAISFVSYHERRHHKQIREVLKKLKG